MKRLLGAAILLGVLSGCHHRINHLSSEEVAAAELFEARHADIPFPLGSVISVDSDDAKGVEKEAALCSYTIAESIPFVCGFYQEEMERWGWQELLSSGDEKEYMLVFQKPGKRCIAVHIYSLPHKARTQKIPVSKVSIFLQ